MPFMRRLKCSKCPNEWEQLAMTRDEPFTECSFGCAEYPEEGLSAPRINRGEARPGITVPQNRGKAEQLAADLALKPSGMTDINTNMRPGDIAAKMRPVPTMPGLTPEQAAAVQREVTPRFLAAAADPTVAGGQIAATGAVDPTRGRNMGILGAMKQSAPLNRLPRTVIADNRRR